MKQVICFHNPDEPNGWLSNWYLSDFALFGVTYTSMEQYMMYQKALCFGDEAMQQVIMQTTDTAKIKAFGRQVTPFDPIVWNGIRQIVVYEGLYAKYSQNEMLKARLLSTGSALLAECSVQDNIWAVGVGMQDERRFEMSSWTGQNLLGFATMLVRERLRKENGE